MRPGRAAGLAASVLLSLTGCGGIRERTSTGGEPVDQPSVDIPVLEGTSGTSPGALTEGRLDLIDGCIVLTYAADRRALALWPDGSAFEAAPSPHVVLPSGDEVAIDGQVRTYGGGFMSEEPPGTALPPPASEIAPLSDCSDRLEISVVWLMAQSL